MTEASAPQAAAEGDHTAPTQYVLVAAGGHGSLGTKTGDSVVAYALPPTDD